MAKSNRLALPIMVFAVAAIFYFYQQIEQLNIKQYQQSKNEWRLQTSELRFQNTLYRVEEFFQDARASLVMSMENPLFTTYFEWLRLPEEQKKMADQENIRQNIENWVQGLQRQFTVGETCLIDQQGVEHMRVVGGQIEKPENFSDKEGDSPFFRESMVLKKGEVISRGPYMSPDSYQWVIAFTSPVELKDGTKPGFFHFEVSTAIFAELLKTPDLGYFDATIKDSPKIKPMPNDMKGRYTIVAADGLVMADTFTHIDYELKSERHPEKAQNLPDYLPPEKMSDYFPPLNNLYPPDISQTLIKAAAEQKKGTLRIERQPGVPHWLLYSPLSHNHWLLVYEEMDYSTDLELTLALSAKKYLIETIFGFIFACAILGAFVRQWTKPSSS